MVDRADRPVRVGSLPTRRANRPAFGMSAAELAGHRDHGPDQDRLADQLSDHRDDFGGGRYWFWADAIRRRGARPAGGAALPVERVAGRLAEDFEAGRKYAG